MCVCSCVPDLNIKISFLTAGCLAFLTSRLFRAASTPFIYSMYIFIFSIVIIMGWNKVLLLLLLLLLLNLRFEEGLLCLSHALPAFSFAKFVILAILTIFVG